MIGDLFRKLWDGATFIAHHLNPFNNVVRIPRPEERAALSEPITTRSGLRLSPLPETKHHNASVRKALSDSQKNASPSSPVRGIVSPMKQTTQEDQIQTPKERKSVPRKTPSKRTASKSPSRQRKMATPASAVAARTRSRSRPPSADEEPAPKKSIKKSTKKPTKSTGKSSSNKKKSTAKVTKSDSSKKSAVKPKTPKATKRKSSPGKRLDL